MISTEFNRFDDALTLCNLFPRGKEQIRDQFKTEISRLKGYFLFSQGSFFYLVSNSGRFDDAVKFLHKGQTPLPRE